MIELVATNGEQVSRVCRKYHVKRLEVFGSAATGKRFDPKSSDLDFLVEFQRTEEMNVADQYFGLWEELKTLFNRPVDLVTVRSLRNPYFIRTVNETREEVYAA